MEPRSFKKLAPAPAPSSSGESPPPTSLTTQGPRKNLTRNACSPCKVKKAKCDGNRPACPRCKKSGDTCLYEVNRRDILKLQLLSDNDIARLQNFELVFGALQSGTEQQAAELLAQIRLGESVDTIASALNPAAAQSSASALSLQSAAAMSSSSATAGDDPSTSSTSAVSQGFLDLLFDRDNWLQPTESTAAHGTQTAQEGMDGFVADSVAVPDGNMPLDSSRPPVSRGAYHLPLSTNATLNQSQDGFSVDEASSSNDNQANHYHTDGLDSLDH
ncbi:hypothetical protein GGR52DRAFT_164324 [Hypoxylon sp. FL1284]|nr:hypothetical protein GGR52DRAFT_164324 [Hypoxylon sp. FL1284]